MGGAGKCNAHVRGGAPLCLEEIREKMSCWKWSTAAAFAAGVGTAAVFGGLYFGLRWRRWEKRHALGWTDPKLSTYLQQHNILDTTLSQLREMSVAHAKGMMTSRVENGKLLTLLCRATNAKKVLDVGVFTGCSAYAMALGMPEDGKVVACDVSEEFTSLGRPYWEQGGMANKIDLRLQPAATTLQELIDNGEEGTFDLMFIDADKVNYPTYFELGMKLLRSGGVFIVDNALWSGHVADASRKDENTLAIRKINSLMRDDPRVDFLLLNIADGTGLAVKL